MKRPAGLTVIGILMVCVSALMALGCVGFFCVAAMGITDAVSADPVSSAIIGMAVGGGFSLLILAFVAAGLANGVFTMREWAWSGSIASIGAGLAFTVISLLVFRRSFFIPFGISLSCHLFVVATSGWMLAYLLDPRVKRVFSALSA